MNYVFLMKGLGLKWRCFLNLEVAVKLRELISKLMEVSKLGIYDRVEARRSILHNDGFYGGVLTPEEVEEELKKVEKLIGDIESLL
jgi:hypothetical protein